MPVNSKSIEFVFDNCFNVLPIILILFLIMFIYFFSCSGQKETSVKFREAKQQPESYVLLGPQPQ